jgi:Outer membrane protein beta-barrel domain
MERILTVTLLSFAIAAPALAAPAANAVNPDATRLYVGAQLGDSIVGGLLGLQINRTFSLEVRYDYIDTIYQPNTTIKASSVGIAGIGMYPVKLGDMDTFYIFGKAGYERTTTKTTTSDPGIPGLFSASTTVTTNVRKRPVVGAGVHYDFSQHASGRIGVNAVGGDHSVYIAALYKF